MKLFMLLVFSTLELTSGKRSSRDKPIVEKDAPCSDLSHCNIANPGQFPWFVSILIDDRFFCSGSLISQKWVMTAAHCTQDHHKLDLVIGSDQIIRESALKVVRHPDYHNETQSMDLALVELRKEIPLSETVRTIGLPRLEDDTTSLEGMKLLLAGWASSDDKLSVWAGVSTPPLRWADRLKVASDSVCYSYYKASFSGNKVCLDTTSSAHSEGVLCFAEGGAPVVFNDPARGHTQIGVLSFGPGPSTLRPPVVALRTSRFLKWIRETTGINIASVRG